MSLVVPTELETEIDRLISCYPEKRSASVMVLHAIQNHFGCISADGILWSAAKLGLQPIHILELVTFYPMFRQSPVGRFHFKICRTLSCALNGSFQVHDYLCQRLGLDKEGHGVQTTKDGRFSVEYVECLASCGTAPAIMVNDDTYEKVTVEQAGQILAQHGGAN